MPALADLYAAQNAYNKGDFATAFREYKALAELGQPLAQANIAMLYAAGRGTDMSLTYAYAWASLAADQGVAAAKELADRIRPDLTPGSLKIADEIRAEFGRQALDEKLMPDLAAGDEDPDYKHCAMRHVKDTLYPLEADRRGIQGGVVVEFSIMPDGRSRNPRILYAIPAGVFEAAVRANLALSDFTPATLRGVAVPCRIAVYYSFELGDKGLSDYRKLRQLVPKTRAGAEAGDPSDQLLYGLMLQGLPQLSAQRKDANKWFLPAAQAGLPKAQYMIGTSLLREHRVEDNHRKGLEWLRKAAEQDLPDAQVTLASYLLRGTPGDDEYRSAKTWLDRAVRSGNADGKYYMAAVQASASSETFRDPAAALQLLKDIESIRAEEPEYHEIRAAALALRGDFAGAAKSQEKALRLARSLGWDLAPLEARLATYRSGKPWFGFLLPFL